MSLTSLLPGFISQLDPEWSSAVPCVLYPIWGSALGSGCLCVYLGQALKVYDENLGSYACLTHRRVGDVLIGGAGGSVPAGIFLCHFLHVSFREGEGGPKRAHG